MTLSKSWGLTLVLYGFSMGLILLEVVTGISISETSMMMVLSLVGISTTAGTTNAVFSNKDAIKKVIEKLIETRGQK